MLPVLLSRFLEGILVVNCTQQSSVVFMDVFFGVPGITCAEHRKLCS